MTPLVPETSVQYPLGEKSGLRVTQGLTAWNGAGGWESFSQLRQVNFSRTVSITFHWRGITSSVSVTSSPTFDSRCEPEPWPCESESAGRGDRGPEHRGRCHGEIPRTRMSQAAGGGPIH